MEEQYALLKTISHQLDKLNRDILELQAKVLLSPHFGQMRRWAVIKMGLEDIHATCCWIGPARGFGLNCPCICILLHAGLNKR
jgi:hypothetical protein